MPTKQGFSQLTPSPRLEAAGPPLKAVVRAVPPEIDALIGRIIVELDEAKAEEIVSIDLAGKTSIADAMVIATGRSNTHVSAIADRVLKTCKEAGFPAPRVEGLPHADWVLVDAGSVIVHLFRPEVRLFYNLEKLWGLDRPADLRSS